MARPAIYVTDEVMIVALQIAAKTINEGRSKKLNWTDVARAALAHVTGTEDPTPGGLDLASIRAAIDLPPLLVGATSPDKTRKKRARSSGKT